MDWTSALLSNITSSSFNFTTLVLLFVGEVCVHEFVSIPVYRLGAVALAFLYSTELINGLITFALALLLRLAYRTMRFELDLSMAVKWWCPSGIYNRQRRYLLVWFLVPFCFFTDGAKLFNLLADESTMECQRKIYIHLSWWSLPYFFVSFMSGEKSE